MDPQELAQTDAPMNRDLTAQVYARQILAAPSLYPAIARGGLGCEAELSSGEAAGAGSSILPNWCIQTLCSSPIPPRLFPHVTPSFALELNQAAGQQSDNSLELNLYVELQLLKLLTSMECYLLQEQKKKLKIAFKSSIY